MACWIWVSLSVCHLWAGNPPATLFSVNGSSVAADEFDRYYQHSRKTSPGMSVQYCLERYIDYRLKVEDARQMRLDTLPAFRQQCAVLQGEVLKEYLLSPSLMESACEEMNRKQSERLLSEVWVELSYATIPLSPHASREAERAAVDSMEAVAAFLRSGGTFGELAVRQQGSMDIHQHVWRPMRGLLQEFSARLADKQSGEMTEPFLSPFGVHVLKVENRRDSIDRKTASVYWKRQWELQGERHPALDSLRYLQWLDGRLEDGLLSQRLEEVRDGLLAVFWDAWNNGMVTQEEQASPSELGAFFRAHQQDYRWELPHYKGAVLRCGDKKTASAVRKRLKKAPVERWKDVFSSLLQEHPEWKAVMTVGLFRIGADPYVDKLAFGCGQLPESPEYPCVFVLGKRLKNGPEAYTDVQKDVEEDYREWQSSLRMQRLKDRFKVEIHADVLKTVNCSGSN